VMTEKMEIALDPFPIAFASTDAPGRVLREVVTG